MNSKHSLCKVLSFRVNQLNECSQKFKEAVNAYVGQITGCAQGWIENSEACDQQQFVEVTVPLEQAMMMLLEMTSEIESNIGSPPLGANSARSVLTSATDFSPQTNVQCLDGSLHSRLECLGEFQNVTDTIQELRTDLDVCKRQVTEILTNVEHLNSQCRMLAGDSSVQQKLNQFKMNKFQKKLSKLGLTLSKTDSQTKHLASVVNTVNEQFTKYTSGSEELHAVERKSTNSKGKKRSGRSSTRGEKLCPAETIIENTDERRLEMEEKLAKLEAENQRMKAQIDRESDERKREHNDVREVQERLSVLELEISNLKGSKVDSLDGSMDSVEDNGSVQSVKENGSVQSVEENGSVQSVKENGSVQSVKENGSVQSVKENGSVQSVEDDRKHALIKTDSVESDVPSKYTDVPSKYTDVPSGVSAAKEKDYGKPQAINTERMLANFFNSLRTAQVSPTEEAVVTKDATDELERMD